MSFSVPPAAGDVGDYANSPTYTLNTKLELEWSGDSGVPGSLLIAHDDPKFNCTRADLTGVWCHAIFENNSRNATSYNWTVHTYGYPVTTRFPWFYLVRVDSDGNSFPSHYFNLTYKAGETSTYDPSLTSAATEMSSMMTDTAATATGTDSMMMSTDSAGATSAAATDSSAMASASASATAAGLGVTNSANAGASVLALVAVLARMIW